MMKIKDFFELMETPLSSVDVDLYFGKNSYESKSMTADKAIAKYAEKEILDFDIGTSLEIHAGISITVEEGGDI